MTSLKLSSVNANHFLVFEAVHRTGSVSAAARELGMTQSGASNALAQLRQVFQDPLFNRVGNAMEPTRLAQKISVDVSSGIEALQRSLTPKSFSPADLTETVTIAMPDYVQMVLLERLASLMRRQAPRATLQVTTWTPQRPPEDLGHDSCVAFVGFIDEPGPEHVTEPLYDDDFILMMRRDHPARGHKARPRPLTVARWVEFGHVVVSDRPSGSTVVDRSLADIGASRHVAAVVDRASLIPDLLRDTDWIAAVGRHWGQRVADRSEGALVVSKPPIRLPRGRIRLVTHRRREEDPMHRWLKELIVRCSPGRRKTRT